LWIHPGPFDWSAKVLIFDVAALVPVAVSWAMGPLLGRMFGSVVLTALAIGLPVAALGWLAEKLAGRDASNLMGLFCLIAIGAGFGVASWRLRDTFSRVLLVVLALGGMAGGMYALAQRYSLGVALLIGAPYVATAFASGLLGGKTTSAHPDPAERERA
jgi:hypothetical protein